MSSCPGEGYEDKRKEYHNNCLYSICAMVGTACINTNTANAQAQTAKSDITKEALGIANSIKASLAYYGLATGAYTEGNEVGPFLNVSSLKKTGNASNTIVNTADYEIAQGLAASAQDRLAKLIARANNTAATPEITSALTCALSTLRIK